MEKNVMWQSLLQLENDNVNCITFELLSESTVLAVSVENDIPNHRHG